MPEAIEPPKHRINNSSRPTTSMESQTIDGSKPGENIDKRLAEDAVPRERVSHSNPRPVRSS